MKSPVKFVDPENMESLEQYGAAMGLMLASLKTYESFHRLAYAKGLLLESEIDRAKSIVWEIQKLMAVTKDQMNDVLERTETGVQDVKVLLNSLLPKEPAKTKAKANK